MTAPTVPTAIRRPDGRVVRLHPPDPVALAREADRLVRLRLLAELELLAHDVTAGRRLDLVAERFLVAADLAAVGLEGVHRYAAAAHRHTAQEAAA